MQDLVRSHWRPSVQRRRAIMQRKGNQSEKRKNSERLREVCSETRLKFVRCEGKRSGEFTIVHRTHRTFLNMWMAVALHWGLESAKTASPPPKQRPLRGKITERPKRCGPSVAPVLAFQRARSCYLARWHRVWQSRDRNIWRKLSTWPVQTSSNKQQSNSCKEIRVM